ncbi:MAG: hypothetical protein JO011_10405 [Ktedonobacteraceae bacterium]|nr:hypothetical protein [Ktedonobacteraceae bacterium]
MTNRAALDGTFHSIETITLRRLIPEARELLVQHGCMMCEEGHEETVVSFPEGTKRQEIWPRVVSERYRIILPDGLELRQVFDRLQEVSQVFIVLARK